MSESCLAACGPIPEVAFKEADVVIRVTGTSFSSAAASSAAHFQCGAHVAAYAATCCLDQWDRPLAGILWVCPRLLELVQNVQDIKDTSKFDVFAFTSRVIAHEIAHILGWFIEKI
jgi:hypothetical protein